MKSQSAPDETPVASAALPDFPARDFLNALAAGTPTPGGGSASAYCGAARAALVEMVARLTMDKPKYAAVRQEMEDSIDRAAKLREELTRAVVGTGEEIRLSSDLKHVIVTAELKKDTEKYLTDKTRFWVVRASVRGGTVSGLGALLAGAYIGIDPLEGGQPTKSFKGLETPPVITTGLPGRHFWLRADTLGSINIGAPIYYRQIQVGQVVSYKFGDDGQSVDIQLFIEAPHHQRVTENTRFWNASWVDVALDAQGLKVKTECCLLSDRIAFLRVSAPPR